MTFDFRSIKLHISAAMRFDSMRFELNLTSERIRWRIFSFCVHGEKYFLNIFQLKERELRRELRELRIKKSGYNEFRNYFQSRTLSFRNYCVRKVQNRLLINNAILFWISLFLRRRTKFVIMNVTKKDLRHVSRNWKLKPTMWVNACYNNIDNIFQYYRY